MIPAVEGLRAILEGSEPDDAVSVAVRLYLADPHSVDLGRMLADLGSEGQAALAVQAALAPLAAGTLLRDLLDGDWRNALDDVIISLDAICEVGLASWALIVRAEMMLRDMADIEDVFRVGLREAVARQAEVFYYG